MPCSRRIAVSSDAPRTAPSNFANPAICGDCSAAITINKVRRQTRKHSAHKRRIEAEGSIGLLHGVPLEAVATDPTPSEAAILVEELEIVSRKLSPLHRQILELRGQGHSISETADVAGCTERTVYRAEERYESMLRERLEQEL